MNQLHIMPPMLVAFIGNKPFKNPAVAPNYTFYQCVPMQVEAQTAMQLIRHPDVFIDVKREYAKYLEFCEAYGVEPAVLNEDGSSNSAGSTAKVSDGKTVTSQNAAGNGLQLNVDKSGEADQTLEQFMAFVKGHPNIPVLKQLAEKLGVDLAGVTGRDLIELKLIQHKYPDYQPDADGE